MSAGENIMNGMIIDDITNFIFIKDEPCAADVIFLPGSNNPLVAERAAELYLDGYVKKILVSGGISARSKDLHIEATEKRNYYNQVYLSEADLYIDVLKCNGVKSYDIISDNKAKYTIQNALYSKQLADKCGLNIKTALLCCKSYHSRRCQLIYQFFFPEVGIKVIPVDVYNINRDNWFMHEDSSRMVFDELAKCGEQLITLRDSFFKYNTSD